MDETIFREEMEGFAMDRVVRDREYTMDKRHFHNEYEIYYLLEGERNYFIERQTYHVMPGSLVLIDRRQIHKTGQAGPQYHDRVLIGVEEAQISPFLGLTGEITAERIFRRCSGILRLDEPGRRKIESLLHDMESELKNRAEGSRFLVLSRVAELLLYVWRQRKDVAGGQLDVLFVDSPVHQKVNEVASYIADHSVEAGSLEQVASRFFMSKSYLSRIFRQVTGFTVNEYINVNRIKKAQDLLGQYDCSITETAERMGYDSITYFEKMFKKYTEITPTAYRRQRKNLLEQE